jgi:hypothetical protein
VHLVIVVAAYKKILISISMRTYQNPLIMRCNATFSKEVMATKSTRRNIRAFLRVLHLSNLLKRSKKGIQRFCIWSLQFGQHGKWGSKLGKNAKLWTTLQTRSRKQSHARGKHARLEIFYFYPLLSLNDNFLGDDLFLSFAFCYGSLQIATNVKSICQSLWRCS